jgi:hypothetical protein
MDVISQILGQGKFGCGGTEHRTRILTAFADQPPVVVCGPSANLSKLLSVIVFCTSPCACCGLAVNFLCLCSDAGSPTEQNKEDYCGAAGSMLGVYDTNNTATQRYVCEREVSTAVCPPGFMFYQDTGTEGQNSCLFVTNAAASWSDAAALCPTGTHLLTWKSTSQTSGLNAFAASSISEVAYVGCSQSGTATQRAAGWSWVDGTAATNLNCGTGNGGDGCESWSTGEPKYARDV